MVAECYYHINSHPETFHSQDLVTQLSALERNNAGQITSRAYTENISVFKLKSTENRLLKKFNIF